MATIFFFTLLGFGYLMPNHCPLADGFGAGVLIALARKKLKVTSLSLAAFLGILGAYIYRLTKKIAFGDNFKRFTQWLGKCFYTFLYHKKTKRYIL